MEISKIVELAGNKASELPERQTARIAEHLSETLREAEQRAYLYDASFGCCSQATLLACQEMLGLQNELAFKAASFFSGGLAHTGELCGALIAGIMVLGMVYGRSDPAIGTTSDSSGIAAQLYYWFKREYGTTSCRELTGVDLLNPEEREAFMAPGSEKHEQCFRRCGKVAAKVLEMICKQGSEKVSLSEVVEREEDF